MLSTEQQNAVAQHLNVRAKRPTCPVCGTTAMRVQKQVVLLPTTSGDGESVKRVLVTCRYCGYDMHFDPSIIGLSLDESSQEA
jgi:RNase P subunit RPR2